MNRYHYRVRDHQGQVFQGHLAAADQEEVVRFLQGKGLFVTSVRAVVTMLPLRRFRSIGTPEEQKIFLLEAWSTFMESGLTIQSALTHIERSVCNRSFQKAIRSIQRSVDQGMKLSDALAASRLFPPSWTAVLERGEGIGDFVRPLRNMRRQLLALRRIKKEALKTLLIPIILAGLTLVWFWIFLHSVIPAMLSFSSVAGLPNPWIVTLSGMIDRLSTATRIGVLLLGLGVLFALRTGRSDYVMGVFQTWVPCRMPVLGPIISNLHLLTIASELQLQLEVGIPVETALHNLSISVPHRRVRLELFRAYERVREGVSADEAIGGLSFVPPHQKALVIAGARSGQFPKAMGLLARFAQEEVRFGMRKLSTFLQTAVVFGCGILVGLVVAAYFGLWITNFSTVFAAAKQFPLATP